MSTYEFFLEQENNSYYPPEDDENDEIHPLERIDWRTHPSLSAEERGGVETIHRN
jgi:hypothetical protein